MTQPWSVSQYQLIQDSADSFRLRVVPGPEFRAETAREIEEAFQKQFRGALRLRVVSVPSIPTLPQIKFTPLVTLARLQELRSQGVNVDIFQDAEPGGASG
jgi:hypothetical protein